MTTKRYTRGKFLGKGGFAKCYEITNIESKDLHAAKVIPKASQQKSRQRAKVRFIFQDDLIQKIYVSLNIFVFSDIINKHKIYSNSYYPK